MPDSSYIPVVQPLPAVDSPLRGLPASRSRPGNTLMMKILKTIALFGLAWSSTVLAGCDYLCGTGCQIERCVRAAARSVALNNPNLSESARAESEILARLTCMKAAGRNPE